MKQHKAPGFWPTRILLAIGIVGTAIVLALAPWAATLPAAMFGGPGEGELPRNAIPVTLAAGIAVIGIAWMIRTFRGPRDAPPPWRHRDR